MDRIRAINLKLNLDKCRFRVSEVSYVGHLLTDQGIKPDPTKTDAVRSMPTPADKHDVQRFLGMTNYLSKFIPGYSEITAPQGSAPASGCRMELAGAPHGSIH